MATAVPPPRLWTNTGIQKAEVTMQLQADNLVIETSEPYGGMPGNVTSKVKEVWSLSRDGKTVTITTTRDIPARHQEHKTGLHADTGPNPTLPAPIDALCVYELLAVESSLIRELIFVCVRLRETFRKPATAISQMMCRLRL